MNKPYLFFKITLLSLLCGAANQHLQAQVSGKVFKDFNANGIQTTAAPDPIEPGLKDVTVNAYDVAGALNSATTIADGTYSISGGTAPYRVEFILPNSYYASKGNVSNTTVQFLATGGTASLGVNYPAQYCDSNNPNLAIPIFVNGDPLQTGASATETALVGFPYNANGVATNGGTPNNVFANNGQTGPVWALAYQKESQKLFSAAFVKRHVGFGPAGLGGIYVRDMASGTTSQFVDLTTIGINLGTVTHTGLTGDKTLPSFDETVYGQVGKTGMGGMDLSDDGKNLFVINLFQKKLHKIFINNPAVMPAAGNVTSYNIPNPNCSNSDFRPFACKYYKGKVYIGGVCSNETAGDTIGMKATVYEFDPVAATFKEVLNYPITFKKGFTDNPYFDRWNPWSDDFSSTFDYAGDTGYRYYPQYILSDIEFDTDETMILGGMDRFGHQVGFENYVPDPTHTNTSSFQGIANAQVYRAGKCGTANQWTIENNASVCGGTPTAGENNNKGPGGGVFYYDNNFKGFHEELSFGGLAMLAGQPEVLEVALDPFKIYTGGIIHLNNTTGKKGDLYEIYSSYDVSGLFGKANGLGDTELLCAPQPIEIGNRVFMDTNSNGEQDAAEMGLDGIVVELWKGGAKVTDVTTTNGGEWFFTNLDADTDYEVKIVGASFPTGKSLTTANVATNAKDLIDNDASLVGADAVIMYKTGSAGQNNHSLDFGFKIGCSLIIASANSTNVTTCNGGNDGTAVVEPSGNAAPVTYLWSNNATTQSVSGLVAGVYSVTVTETPTCTAVASVTVTEPSAVTVTCSKTDVTTNGGSDGTASVSASGGTSPYTYLWSNNATSASITGLTAGTYTVTVTDANGCTKVCSSIVGEPAPAPCPVQICTPVRITKI